MTKHQAEQIIGGSRSFEESKRKLEEAGLSGGKAILLLRRYWPELFNCYMRARQKNYGDQPRGGGFQHFKMPRFIGG
jgi:hypothetical protein